MKIRTDFVTNSSSSSFITIQVHTKRGSFTIEELPADGYEYLDQRFEWKKSIDKLLDADNLEEMLYLLLNGVVSPYDDEEEVRSVLEDSMIEVDLSLPASDIEKIEVSYAQVNYGEFMDVDYLAKRCKLEDKSDIAWDYIEFAVD